MNRLFNLNRLTAFMLFALPLVGCASPLDILIPTPKPSVVTEEYLGHLRHTNRVNGLYHSLSDTKINKALVPVRKMELEGLYHASKGELDIIDGMASQTSNALWGLGTAVLTALGYFTPRPQEKAKVNEALHKEPPKA